MTGLLVLLISALAQAQLTIDITKGVSGSGIPIVIAPFGGGAPEDIAAVIAADLDLRYLYRNQLLTALDDARAEWKYQTQQQQQQQQQSSVDWTELVHLLKQAQMACQQWFDFIDERDVQEAIKVVDLEWEKK